MYVAVRISLKHVQVLALDLGALIAKYLGGFEERLKGLIEVANKRDENVVLFIDEFHMLVGMGRADGAIDAGNSLLSIPARDGLRAIGATTLEEYRRHIETDGALERRLQIVHCKKTSVEENVSMLRGLSKRYQVFQGLRIGDSALMGAAKLSSVYVRFIPMLAK